MPRWADKGKAVIAAAAVRLKSDTQRLAAQLANLELERTQVRIDRQKSEEELDTALLRASDPDIADRPTAEDLAGMRAEVRQWCDREAELDRLIRKVSEQAATARANAETAARAKAIERSRDALEDMTEALRMLSAAGDMVAAAARKFFSARERLFEHLPGDIRPLTTPSIWLRPEVYLLRHIGARSTIFRKEALAGTVNVDRLAQVDEIAELHADACRQVFPNEQPPQAA